jgi:endonuclease YncB( thermonuclease family)
VTSLVRAARQIVAPCALVALSLAPFVRAQTDAPPLVTALVTRAVDGDTLDAQVNGARTPVGYLGASAPPVNRPCGQEAYERNRELVAQGVLLEVDPLYTVDDRRRVLFYAYTPDGTSIEATLIREGLAQAARTDGAHGADLAALEAEASSSGQGCLWSP